MNNDSESYWYNLINDYDDSIGILSLKKNGNRSNKLYKVDYRINNELVQKLGGLANKLDITVSSIFEVALSLLLKKFNNVNDVVFGKINYEKKDSSAFIDHYILPVRVTIHREDKIEKLFQDVTEQWDKSKRFADSLSKIYSLTEQGEFLFKVVFSYSKIETSYDIVNDILCNYDTQLYVEILDDVDSMIIKFTYDESVYSKDEIESICAHYKYIISEIVNNYLYKINDIHLIPQEEMNMIMNDFNNQMGIIETERTVIQLFKDQVKLHKDNIAIIFQQEQIAYAELDKKVNILANQLKHKGIKRGDYVLLFMNRRVEMVVSYLAIFEIGGVIVPINCEASEQYINNIKEECHAKFLLTYDKNINSNAIVVIDIKLLSLDDQYNLINMEPECDIDSIAFCLFTSGTTGKPKGVLISHKGFINAIVPYIKVYYFTANDVIMQYSDCTYIQSLSEIFNILIVGGTICLITEDVVYDPRKIVKYCNENEVTFVSLTPTVIAELNPCKIKNLRVLDTTGEPGDVEILKKWTKHCDKIINSYGATEVSGNTSSYIYQGEDIKTLPIGRPVSPSKYYILDNDDHICAVNMIGELCISGPLLALGYLNNDKLTERKFVQNPYTNERMYRTGDLARWLSDGNVECLGRIDNQVKIHGCRVELDGIKKSIKDIEYIEDCAVIIHKDEKNDRSIYAFFVSSVSVDIKELYNELSKTQKQYEIPSYLIQVPSIPKNKHGKLDKAALLKFNLTDEKYIEPKTEEEKIICEAFSEVFGICKIGTNTDFFLIGGDSIKAIRIATYINGYQYQVTAKDIMKNVTIKKIAIVLRKEDKNQQLYDEKNDAISDNDLLSILDFYDTKGI